MIVFDPYVVKFLYDWLVSWARGSNNIYRYVYIDEYEIHNQIPSIPTKPQTKLWV